MLHSHETRQIEVMQMEDTRWTEREKQTVCQTDTLLQKIE